MNLLDSLLDAITRLEGDALVMHVGEKPYVVTTSSSMNEFRGPIAWGQVELSSRVLTSEAVLGMLGQLLPLDQRSALDEFGAVEYDVAPPEGSTGCFTVVAARGGEDVWLEVRRHVPKPAPAAEETPAAAEMPPEFAAPVTAAAESIAPVETAAPEPAPEQAEDEPFEIVPEVAQAVPTDEEVDALLAGTGAALLQTGGQPEIIEPHAEMQISFEAEAPVGADALADVPEPIAVEPEPVVAAPEPVAVEPEPVQAEPEPVVAEPEPVALPPEPVAIRPESIEIEPQPIVPAREVVEPRAPEPAVHVEDAEPAVRSVVVPLIPRPVSRPVSTPACATASIDEVLRTAAGRGASTVYLVAQSRPMLRSDGEMALLDMLPTTAADVDRIVLDLAPEAAREAWQRGAPAEWMCDVDGVGRVCCLTFLDHRGPGVIFRMIPPQAISADQLGLTLEVQALCAPSDGLVIVAGPRASGKSTLMAAFVDLINRTRSDHLISIEREIEFVHESRHSFISQREVRDDGEHLAGAIRSALREDPDVLLVPDLRSADVVTAALEAVESGRLIFASVTAPSAAAAVEQVVELFAPERRRQACESLARALRGVVAQVLLRRIRGGRTAAREVLLNTPAVATLIQDGRFAEMSVAMESGRRHGMTTLNDAFAGLVLDGTVHVTEAYRRAFDREGLLAALRRDGADTSFAERLA